MKHWLKIIALTLLVGTAAAAQTEPVTDFSGDLPTDDSNATIVLLLDHVRPLKDVKAGSIAIILERRDGAFAPTGHRAAADYNQISQNPVVIKEARLEGNDISGTVLVTINPDKPFPNKPGGFPTPPDMFELSFAGTIDRTKEMPYRSEAESFMPPWRKDMPRFGGKLITGNFKGSWGSAKKAATGPATMQNPQHIAGAMTGAINAAPVPGVFGARGNITMAKAPAGGADLTVRLATTRVAAPSGASITKYFVKPHDWSQYDGLRLTVSSPERRDDATVSLAIHEADGAWYSCNGAAMLLGRKATVDVPFGDLVRSGGFDSSHFLDLDRINALSLGIDNPYGVGEVRFTVHQIELYRNAHRPTTAPAAVTVKIDPDVVLSINGTDQVPKGLFGFHTARGLSADAKYEDGTPMLEYVKRLNPGYLRPLDHVFFSAKPITDEEVRQRQQARIQSKTKPDSLMYQLIEAANAVDNTVWCHTVDLWQRPPWMDADMAQFLSGVRSFYRKLGADAWVPGDDFNALRWLEVWNEPFMWGRHMNMGDKTPAGRKRWDDPTQYGYIPGKAGMDVYSDLFEQAVQGAKSANPHVRLGGPSAPAFNEDGYGNFEHYVRYFIDRCHDKIDFLTEHHYQGHPDAFAASYLVAAAYTDVKYNRRIPVYNTEANDLVDTPTKGEQGQLPLWSLKADELNRAHYNIQDIMACLRYCPDIAKGRAMHALWSGFCKNPGETHAYTLMATLRGKMLAAASEDPQLLVAASSPSDGSVVVLLLNNSPRQKRVTLPVPQGFTQTGFQQLVFEDGTRLVDKPTAASSQAGQISFLLGPRLAARCTLTKEGYVAGQRKLIETSFADCVLARVGAKNPVNGRIVWRGKGPEGATAASLCLVTRGVDRGEAVAVINGVQVPLPWSTANDGAAVVQEVKLDPAVLKAAASVEFRCVDPDNNNGFTVWAAWIQVER